MPLSDLDEDIASHHVFANEAHWREVFARVRAEDPVHLTKTKAYAPFWAVTKHADVMEVERQSDKFLNAPMTFMLDRVEHEERMKETKGAGSYVRTLVHMDGTEHRAMRGLTQAWFMPQNIKRLDAMVQQRATEMVDMMLERGSQCDFAEEIAPWYPLRVIMSLLGMPEDRHPDLLRLTQRLLAPYDAEFDLEGESPNAAKKKLFAEFGAHFQYLIAARKEKPEDDLATLLVSAQIDGKPLGPMELFGYFAILSTAGHDTTASSLGGGMLALLEHPEQCERLRKDPSLLPGAVEEMLRWSSPVRHFTRTANEDYVLRGKQIMKGDYLMMCYPSANFDEEVFPDGHLFRIDRTPNRHMAFGFGVHSCLGQHLSRMELKAFFAEFLKRVPHVELDGTPAFVSSNQVSGVRRLKLRYAEAAAA